MMSLGSDILYITLDKLLRILHLCFLICGMRLPYGFCKLWKETYRTLKDCHMQRVGTGSLLSSPGISHPFLSLLWLSFLLHVWDLLNSLSLLVFLFLYMPLSNMTTQPLLKMPLMKVSLTNCLCSNMSVQSFEVKEVMD